MKHYTLIFAACLCIAIVAVPQPKTKAVPVDEVECHLQEASVATAQAHDMGEKMVEEKVAEKEELKQAVVEAEAKTEAMTNTMLFMGVDTALIHMDTASISNMLKLNGMR